MRVCDLDDRTEPIQQFEDWISSRGGGTYSTSFLCGGIVPDNSD